MAQRAELFSGDDPMVIVQRWMDAASESELNDPDAVALATVDGDGMPNARVVLLKEIEADAFVFYTNYGSAKAREIDQAGKAAFIMHWKSLRRQIRVRGLAERVDAAQSDAYYASRDLKSRLGAWASKQSQPLESREALMAVVEQQAAAFGDNPPRPTFWGGFRITPLEIEFWADGEARLHDRFQWRRATAADSWKVMRLNP